MYFPHFGVLERVDNVKRGRGRSKLTWVESVKRDLKDWNISKEIVLDRSAWRLAINVLEPWTYFFRVSSLAYSNLLGKKGYVVVVVVSSSLSAGWFWWCGGMLRKITWNLGRFTWAPFWVPSSERGPDWTPALNSPCGAKQNSSSLCLGVACLALLQHQLRAVQCCPWPMQRQWQADAFVRSICSWELQTMSVPFKKCSKSRHILDSAFCLSTRRMNAISH